ncbi:MAG: hypothetical protein O3C43_13970 [Verrucomicrobia bacterium]|nr:hypothetical protein [Verrucomicrobiota bacterium]MDA1067598.1 hypothetical protein [Verrucomicrobiota bacterium]
MRSNFRNTNPPVVGLDARIDAFVEGVGGLAEVELQATDATAYIDALSGTVVHRVGRVASNWPYGYFQYSPHS